MGDLVGKAQLLHSSRAVAAAHDGHRAGLGQSLGHGLGAAGELVKLEHAHGPVPNDGACALDGLGEQLHGLGADVHAHQVLGDVTLHQHRLCLSAELSGAEVVNRQQELHALGSGLLDHLLGVVQAVSLQQAGADLVALGLLEGIGHAAADDDGVSLLQQVVDDVDLVGDLGAAQHRHEGALGVVQGLAHDAQLLVDQQAGVSGQVSGHAGGGGVGTVHGAEGVGDEDVGHVSQGLGKVGAVLLLADIEAEVLKKHDLAGLQSGGLGLGVLTDDVGSKDHFLTQQLAKALGNGGQGQLGLPLALGLAQVGAGDHGSAVFQQVLDGGDGGNDPLVAGDLTGLFVLRNVKVAAEKHLLALDVNIINSLLVVVHDISS